MALGAPLMADEPNPPEITKGMSAMRIRIIRAELLAGSKVLVFSAPMDGDEALVDQGVDAQPRATSNGAVLSVSISPEQNSTFSRAIRAGQEVFFSRDGSNRPLYPTVHRLPHRPRVRVVKESAISAASKPDLTPNDVPREHLSAGANVVPETSDANDVPEIAASDSPKSMMWKAITVVLSGAAWISVPHGLRNGRIPPSTYFAGALMLMGGSEFTDYPVLSTAWNAGEPILRQAGNVTMGRLSASADTATEGVLPSAKFMVWWIVGLVVIIFGAWMCMIWIAEYLMRRTRSVGRQNVPGEIIEEPPKPPVTTAVVGNAGPVEASMSGPTSGNVSEEGAVLPRMICQSDMVMFDDNGMRQMSGRKCMGPGNLKTDLMYGHSLMMPNGTIVACNQARVEVSVCKTHVGEYLERIKDISCEQVGCMARGMMGKIGEKVVRERNEHIGIRIMRETDVRQASQTKGNGDPEKDTPTDKTGGLWGVPLSAPDNRNAENCVVLISDDSHDPNIAQAGGNTTGRVSTTTEPVRSYGDI